MNWARLGQLAVWAIVFGFAYWRFIVWIGRKLAEANERDVVEARVRRLQQLAVVADAIAEAENPWQQRARAAEALDHSDTAA